MVRARQSSSIPPGRGDLAGARSTCSYKTSGPFFGERRTGFSAMLERSVQTRSIKNLHQVDSK